MALPAFVVKAKDALAKAQKVRQVKNAVQSSNSEDSPNFFRKLFLLGGIVFFVIMFLLMLPIFTVSSFAAMFELQAVDPNFNGNSSGVNISTQAYINWAINIANDDSHGYSQCARTGPDYDCASLVWYSLVEGAGIDKAKLGNYAFLTYTMGKLLKAAGFSEHKFTSMDELQAGDILVFPGDISKGTGHTEIYIGDGKNVGAHISEKGVCGNPGDQTGNEISVTGYSDGGWEYYYRPENSFVGGVISNIEIKKNVKMPDSGLCGRESSDSCTEVATVTYTNGGTVTYYMEDHNNANLDSGTCRANAFMAAVNAINNTQYSVADLQDLMTSNFDDIVIRNPERFGVAISHYNVNATLHFADLSDSEAMQLVRNNLNQGKPAIIFVDSDKCGDLAQSHHALLLIGYENNDPNGPVIFLDSCQRYYTARKRSLDELTYCLSPPGIQKYWQGTIIFN